MNLDFNNIHRFVFDDLAIVLDINSGSVHVFDEDSMLYLDYLEKHGEPIQAMRQLKEKLDEQEVEEISQAVTELIKEGLLFSEADFSDFTPHTKPIVKALCLHMAHDCNLRCGYCFADSGAYGGPRGMMRLETAKKAIDFLIEASQHRNHIEVDFFGGEPLLNFKVCQETADYAMKMAEKHQKTLKLTLTTNGALLNEEVQAWLADRHIDAVLSLDGREEVHNQMRPFVGGKDSYASVVKNLQAYAADSLKRGDWHYIRGTYTHFNTDFHKDVMHMVDDLGFSQLSMEPVVADENAGYSLKEEDKATLLHSYDELTRHYLKRSEEGKPYSFYHFNMDFSGGPCLPKRLSGCGSGHDYMAVSPEGDLYPCHQFVGEQAYCVGSVYKGVERPEIAETFQQATVLTKKTCMQCWARFYCSGGCHANNIRYGGGLDEPYTYACDLQRKRLECAIYLECKHLLANLE